MSDCSFYNVHFMMLRSREIGSANPVQRIPIPYCKHPYSPFEEFVAKKGVIGAGTELRCGGNLSACQLPADKRGF